jgi:hypothetical protein
MHAILLLVMAALVGVEPAGPPAVALYGDTKAVFADMDAGRAVLTTRDAFVAALSPFDRAARLKTGDPVSEQAFLEYVGKQVRPWSDAERAKLTGVLEGIRPKLAAFRLALPAEVLFIKTTGEEEGRAAYTRGRAIILPQMIVDRSADHLEGLVTHELFHVMSRYLAATDAKRRDALYAVVGFARCGTIELPGALKDRKITNPDAPTNGHDVEVEHDGAKVLAVPVLFATPAKYDATKGGPFFGYLTFKLMLIEREGDAWRAKLTDGKPVLLNPGQTPSYRAKVGRNTGYIIHPEEVLADNFVLLVQGKKDVPTPGIIEAMRTILAR